MFVKIYDKIINYIKEEYKFLIVLLLILFFGLFQLPFNIYMGGGLIDIKNRVTVEKEYSEKGSFNMTYVKSSRATIPTYLLSYLFDWERESINNIKIDDNDNAHDMWQRDLIYLQEANDNAIICAYHKAGETITIKKELLKVLYVEKDSDTNLMVGDIILKIDNKEVNTYEKLKKILDNYQVNDRIEITLLRNNQEEKGYAIVHDIAKEKRIGIYIAKLYDYDLSKKVELNFPKKEGGPSGGFMLSLAIYNRLIQEDITRGLKIAGTGTIDENGNVGEIGGVKYKLMGAVHGKADVFFVPEENYIEAEKVNEERGYQLNIVKVKTIDDAINYLRSK